MHGGTVSLLVLVLTLLVGGVHGEHGAEPGAPREDPRPPEPSGAEVGFTTIRDAPIGAEAGQGEAIDGRCVATTPIEVQSGPVAQGEGILGTMAFDEECVLRLVDKYVGSDRPVIVELGPGAQWHGDSRPPRSASR